MAEREYDAILLDLDGTLLSSADELHPDSLEALNAARAEGVKVMLVKVVFIFRWKIL